MASEGIIEFLRVAQPFARLAPEALEALSEGARWQSYATGDIILRQGGEPGRHLYLIRRGGVKVVLGHGGTEEMEIDRRGEGESFGFLSMVGADRSRADIVAVRDTECLLLERQQVMAAMVCDAALIEHFFRAYLTRFVDRTYAEMSGRSALALGNTVGGGHMYTVKVGEMVSREPLTAPLTISIAEAATLMSRHRVSSLILTDQAEVPVGILTDRDLRDKVLSRGKGPEEPVANVMSVALIRVEARDYAFEALLKMLHYGIHHLLVVEEGRLKGIVTNHDFMMMQGNSPIALAREMERQPTVEAMAPVARKTASMVTLMLREGARAQNITHVISALNDRLLRRAVQMVERRLGPPPVSYCFMVYGSEGRHEQTFKTDQDNAIIYADPADQSASRKASEYFAALGTAVSEALIMLGFPKCPGGYMAMNPKWCQPLSQWKRYFSEWISAPTPEAVLSSEIFFDFRGVAGDLSLASSLRQYVTAQASTAAVFHKYMADAATSLRPPLGLFGGIQVERKGPHEGRFNIKERCVALIVDVARLMSLEAGVEETSTYGRLRALKGRHPMAKLYGEELERAFEFAMHLRMEHQARLIAEGAEPDNFIEPRKLGSLDVRGLKETFRLLLRVQESLYRRYNPGRTL